MKSLKQTLLAITIYCALFSIHCTAQQQTWNWYFGDGAAVNFSTGSPVAVSGSAMNTGEGCATISDNIGNLLFYTDGQNVYNRNNLTMPNGNSTLYGHSSSTQSGVIVQKPGSTTLYYIFTADAQGGSHGICYSIVDMTLDAGLGDVTIMNTNLLMQGAEKITAVRHCNGVDVWVIVHDLGNNSFYAYLLTNAGVQPPVQTDIGIQVINYSGGWEEAIGCLKASPNGRKLAVSIWQTIDSAQVYDFDNQTGILSNAIALAVPSGNDPYGVSFSPNDSVLYVSCWSSRTIYQYDLSSNNSITINASRYQVTTASNNMTSMQLGIDGKLYVSPYPAGWLDVINNPNILGVGCNYVSNILTLTGQCQGGLPNFVDAFYSPPPATSENVNIVSCDTFIILSPTGTGNSYLWSTGATTDSITVDTAGTYWVHVIGATACTQIVNIADTFNVTFALPPIVNLGPDHFVCGNGPDTLRAGNPGDTYLWNTGATTQNISINSTGTYSVAVNNGGCTGYDTVVVTFVTNPTVDLGPDTTLCFPQHIILDAGNTGFNFLWNTGATTQTINVNLAGTYIVYVSQSVCHGRDTIIISIANPPVVNIGPDSTICSNQSVTLNAGNTGSSFTWSTGATTQIINASTTGVYWVHVSSGGCSANDSATITVINLPVVNLGPDQTICIGDSISLNALNTGYNFHWSTGATSQTINVTTAGNYSVLVNIGLCASSDTIHISTINPPVVNLGNDTIVCSPNPVILNAGNPGSTFVWSTGDQTQTITVTTAGVYTVLVNNQSCMRIDTIIISVVTPPVLSTRFVADTTKGCNPLTINLTNNSSGATSCFWRFGDGQTSTLLNPDHTYTDSGMFTVTLTIVNDTSTVCGRFTDSVIYSDYIAVADPVHVTSNFSGSPLHGCSPLIVDFTNNSSNGTSFYWNFGNGSSSNDQNPLQTFYSYAGTYNVTLIASSPNTRCYNPPDTMNIQIIADTCNLYIPNVFTPNGDGKNEFFHVIGEGYANYHLVIFNRWGEKLFESNNKLNLWNGQIDNSSGIAPDGTYYYIFTAIDPDEKPYSDHGFLTLIR